LRDLKTSSRRYTIIRTFFFLSSTSVVFHFVLPVSSTAVCFFFMSVSAFPSSSPIQQFREIIFPFLHCYFLAHWFLFLSLSVYVFHYFPLSSYFLYPFLPLSPSCFVFSEQLSLYLLFASRNLFLSVLMLFHSVNTFTASFFNYSHSLSHHSIFLPVLFAPLTIISFFVIAFSITYFFQFNRHLLQILLFKSVSSLLLYSSTSCLSHIFIVCSSFILP
jgi:hypothetical protein